MENHYCWRCKTIVPLLDESEWLEISPLLDNHVGAVKAYRDQHAVDLETARQNVADMACATFKKITGFHETNYAAIYHHRLSLWGPPCQSCGQMLRTPLATFCASCGTSASPSPPEH